MIIEDMDYYAIFPRLYCTCQVGSFQPRQVGTIRYDGRLCLLNMTIGVGNTLIFYKKTAIFSCTIYAFEYIPCR